jgi:glycosyltransferase involved in cell wall biosynthesis
MRIAHVSDSYLPRLGGMEIQVAELAARQYAVGHRVKVVTASGGEADPDGPPVPIRRLLDGSAHPVAGRLLAPASAARAVLGGGFEVVHAHVGVGSPVAFAAAAAAAGAGIPTVITVHSLWAYVYPIFRGVDLVAGLSRLPIRWTAVSEAAAGPVRRLLPPGSVVSVIPNGVEPADWSGPSLPRDPGTVSITAAMRLTARKRILPLLRMLRLARDRVPADIRVRAVIVGDGPRRPAAQRYLDEHDMASWVTLPGRLTRPDIARIHRSGDFFVAPADLESFGIAALEARCAGLPVLAKTKAGVRDYIRHGQEGMLARDDAQMVDHLVRLTTDHRLRESIRAHNQRTPCPINWDSVLARTDGAYQDALRTSTRGTRGHAPTGATGTHADDRQGSLGTIPR